MAVNLTAVFKMRDQGSSKMRKITQEMNKMNAAATKVYQNTSRVNKALGDVGRQADKTNRSFSKFGKGLPRSLSSISSSLNPVALGFSAVASAAAAAYTGVKVFNATVGEAMRFQQSQVVISAMLNDEQLAKQYMQMVDRMAIDSPVLNSQGMYENSKAFLTSSKDIRQLEKMWGLAERMVAIDPVQGVDGAVLALRELFSGDSMSMVERFEMSRDVMNDIKKLPLDQQLKKLDEYFNKIGLTTRVIEDMGGTALGTWAQVQERWQLVLRQMGEPSIKVVSEFLGEILDRLEGPEMQKYAQWGAEVIKNMLQGLSNSAIKLYDWFGALQNDPEFLKKTTLAGKVDFIVADIVDRMREWYNGGGKEKIEEYGSDILQTLMGILNNSDEFFKLGADLGISLGKGVMEGIIKSGAETALGKFTVNGLGGVIERNNAILTPPSFNLLPGFYHGLDEVKYDNQIVRVHKGEKILTAQEAKAYDEGKAGSGSVTITGNTFNVREEADVEKIAYKLARLIEKEAFRIGY